MMISQCLGLVFRVKVTINATCRSRSSARMLSTADTPLMYFSMYVSPSAVPCSFCDAAICARLSRSSKSSDAWHSRPAHATHTSTSNNISSQTTLGSVCLTCHHSINYGQTSHARVDTLCKLLYHISPLSLYTVAQCGVKKTAIFNKFWNMWLLCCVPIDWSLISVNSACWNKPAADACNCMFLPMGA